MVELAQKAIVDDALRALLYEVSVNPKPGLWIQFQVGHILTWTCLRLSIAP